MCFNCQKCEKQGEIQAEREIPSGNKTQTQFFFILMILFFIQFTDHIPIYLNSKFSLEFFFFQILFSFR